MGVGLGLGSGLGVGFGEIEPGAGLGYCGSCTLAMWFAGDSAKAEPPDNAAIPISVRTLLARITRVADCMKIYLRGRLIEIPVVLDRYVR